jgi:hypothetical protein
VEHLWGHAGIHGREFCGRVCRSREVRIGREMEGLIIYGESVSTTMTFQGGNRSSQQQWAACDGRAKLLRSRIPSARNPGTAAAWRQPAGKVHQQPRAPAVRNTAGGCRPTAQPQDGSPRANGPDNATPNALKQRAPAVRITAGGCRPTANDSGSNLRVKNATNDGATLPPQPQMSRSR